jgi:hypothetical protein
MESTLHQEEGVIYRKLKLWVLCSLRDSVLQSKHESTVAGYMGKDKMKELIRQNFWGPKMNEDIIKYVQSCPECLQNNVAKHKAYGLLQPLEPGYTPWQSITIDFITNLPLSDVCKQLWLIIPAIPKWRISYPYRTRTKRVKTSR